MFVSLLGQLFNFNFEDGPGRYEATPEGRQKEDYSYMGTFLLFLFIFFFLNLCYWLGVRLKSTHLSLASHKRDIDKQWRPWSDAAECGVWSMSTLFALSTRISIINDATEK